MDGGNQALRELGVPVLILLLGCAGEPQHLDSGVRFEEVAAFGCVDCPGPELFGGIISLSAGPEGILAILTSDPPFGRLIKVATHRATTFAAEGDGPGEVRWPLGIAVLHDGRIGIAGRTMDVFDPSGRHLERVLNEPGDGFRTLQLIAAPANGWVLQFRTSSYPEGSYQLRLLDGDLRVVSRIPFPDEIWNETEDRTNPFGLAYAVSDEGRIAIGTGRGEYRIVLVDGSGRVVARGGRDIPMPERTEKELAELRQSLSRVPSPEGEEPSMMTTNPHFRYMRFDSSGRLWVQTARGAQDQTVFDIFSPQLTYLGEAMLPEKTGVFQVRDGELIAQTRGELDTPVAKVWRIVGLESR